MRKIIIIDEEMSNSKQTMLTRQIPIGSARVDPRPAGGWMVGATEIGSGECWDCLCSGFAPGPTHLVVQKPVF